jgi:hypothetical protein
MHALGIILAMLAAGRIPVAASTGKIGRRTVSGHVDMHTMRSGGQAFACDHQPDSATSISCLHTTARRSIGRKQRRRRRLPAHGLLGLIRRHIASGTSAKQGGSGQQNQRFGHGLAPSVF